MRWAITRVWGSAGVAPCSGFGRSPGMLTRPAGHEAEARKSEAEDEAEAQYFFRGRGQTR